MKKITTFFSIALFMLLFNSNVFCQIKKEESTIRVGLYGSAGYSSISGLRGAKKHGLPDVNYNTNNISSKNMITANFGISFQYEEEKYFIQADFIGYNFTGTKLRDVYNKENSKIHSIDIEGALLNLYIGKKYKLSNEFKFIVGIGPCLFYNYTSLYSGSGKGESYEVEYYDEEYDYYYYKTEYHTYDKESPKINTYQLGVTALVGIETSAWQIGIVSDYSFSKMFTNSNLNAHHKSIRLSLILWV